MLLSKTKSVGHLLLHVPVFTAFTLAHLLVAEQGSECNFATQSGSSLFCLFYAGQGHFVQDIKGSQLDDSTVITETSMSVALWKQCDPVV